MDREALTKPMMDHELVELQQVVMLENGTMEASSPKEPTIVQLLSPMDTVYDEECARYEEVRGVTETGNGLKLEELLGQWHEKGWLRDWRNEEEITLYADAITDGYLDIIKVLLSFDIPLGDALIRAIDVEFDDAIKVICRYLESREDLREWVLAGNSDNDDFHHALTPLILAAQRNNFGTVKLLVDLGCKITEPALSQGGDVTLTQAISTLHVYRALSQPAYILATQTDIFGHAFEMSAKLKTLSRTWEDFGAEYKQMAGGIEVFAAEMLGQSSSTEEILALFRYHNTDKYRNSEGKQHSLAKLFEAITYQQKEFIAHPHSQKAIIVQFYRSLLDWNERGMLYQMLLILFVVVGYPIICILYIVMPVRKVVDFARLPYIMMMMKAGSGFTFLFFIIAVTVVNKHSHPWTVESVHTLILIWIIGLTWMHIKLILKDGLVQYLSDSVNLHELVIMGLYFTVFILRRNGGSDLSEDGDIYESGQGANLSIAASSDVQDYIASFLSALKGNLNVTNVDGVNGILVKALSSCRPRNSSNLVPLPGVGSSFPNHPELGQDQFEATVIAGALLGVAITISILRMLNLLLVSDFVGPLRISLGGMIADIVKFLGIFMVIWFAFAIGLFQNYYSAGQSATRACIGEGNEPDSCQFLVGFSTFIASMKDLYWSLYGLTEIGILVLPGKHSVAEGVGTLLYVGYLVVAVLVLLNALIGMLSNTYNLTEEHADTEWKFHRAAVWATYLRPVETLPPPFNLIASIKSLLYRLCLCCIGMGRNVVSLKDVHNEKELEDYGRVLKLVSTRYIQANLSTESQNNENVRPRDLQTLRNDILAFKFSVQDRLEKVGKTLGVTKEKTSTVHQKLHDLHPLSDKTEDLLHQSTKLNDNVVTLFGETGELQQRQETDITQRDRDAFQSRETIAKLQANIAELIANHSAEAARRDKLEANMTTTIHGLHEDNTSLTDTVSGLTKDKSKLTRQVRELIEESLISEREALELGDIVDDLRGEVERLKTNHASEVSERDRKQAEQNETIRKVQDENKGLADIIQTLEKDKAELAKQVDELSDGNDSLKLQPSTLKYTIAAHRVDIETLTGSHSAEIAGRDQQEAKLNNTIKELQDETMALTDNIHLLDEIKSELTRKLSELTEKFDVLETKSSEMKNTMAALQDELEQLKTSHSADVNVRDQKGEKLKNTLRDLQEDRVNLTGTVRELGEEKAELTRTLRQLVEETDAIVRETSDMKDAMTALQGEIEELKSNHSTQLAVRDQKEAKLNDAIRELHEANKGLIDKVRDLDEDNTDLTTHISELNKGTDVLQKNSSEMRNELAGLQVEIKQVKITYSEELDKIDREKKKLQDTLSLLEEEKSGLKNIAQALQLEMEQLKSNHSAEVVERNREDTELKDTIRRHQKEKNGLENIVRGLNEDKAELTRLVGELNQELMKRRRPEEPKHALKQASHDEEPNESGKEQGSLFNRNATVLGRASVSDKEGENADNNDAT